MSLTQRIQALTAYANEVTGASDTTLADAVATLAEGYGQGGGYDVAWADVTVITIPANTVTNTAAAKALIDTIIDTSKCGIILLMSEMSRADQMTMMYARGAGMTRNRNGNFTNVSIDSRYDCYLVEGSQYLAFRMKNL